MQETIEEARKEGNSVGGERLNVLSLDYQQELEILSLIVLKPIYHHYSLVFLQLSQFHLVN